MEQSPPSHKRNSFFTADRIMIFFGFCALFAGTIGSLFFNAKFKSIIPHTEIIIPLINGSCAVAAAVLLFMPENLFLNAAILLVEAVATLLTGWNALGCFLFTALIVLLFCSGFFTTHPKAKAGTLGSVWLLTLLGVYPYGWDQIIFNAAVSVFMLSFFVCIYKILEEKLSFLLSKATVQRAKESITLPTEGSELHLNDYGLSERQVTFVMGALKNGASYKELSSDYHVSLSTVKQELAKTYKIFGVANREQLCI